MIEQAMKMGSVLLEAVKMAVLLVPKLVRWDKALLFFGFLCGCDCSIRWMKQLRAETNMLRLLCAYGHQVFDVIPQRNWTLLRSDFRVQTFDGCDVIVNCNDNDK
ncbi:hypothetical protein RHMOL_Rhmol01G0163200 [Rhododendron molle]|nr:hypothetical protein RHMOL_Rhmol01G0163200 [Rhododendron molle]